MWHINNQPKKISIATPNAINRFSKSEHLVKIQFVKKVIVKRNFKYQEVVKILLTWS